MTAALAAVLLALAGYVIQGTVHTTRATEQQSHQTGRLAGGEPPEAGEDGDRRP